MTLAPDRCSCDDALQTLSGPCKVHGRLGRKAMERHEAEVAVLRAQVAELQSKLLEKRIVLATEEMNAAAIEIRRLRGALTDIQALAANAPDKKPSHYAIEKAAAVALAVTMLPEGA